jgi:hypothetical protein
MNEHRSRLGSFRRALAIGSTVILVGTTGTLASRADSTGTVGDPLVMRHGRGVVHELPSVRAHGPRQTPKVGRIARASGEALDAADRLGP